MNPILMKAVQLALLHDWAVGQLASAHLALYSTNLVVHDNLEIGALDIVTEPGMISVLLVWNGPYFDMDGQATLAAISQLFASTGVPTVPFQVYGWCITDAAGTTLFAAKNFDAPFTVSDLGHGVTVVPEIKPFPVNP